MKHTTYSLDIGKQIFHLVVMDPRGQIIKRKQLKRHQVLDYFSQLPVGLVAMESCGGAHYWARSFQAIGHDVRLIAPQYVKPFVKGNKNDYNDAEGIGEAAQRPRMRFVPIKSVEQQDIQNYHRQRAQLQRDRLALCNQIRGICLEYGVPLKLGLAGVRRGLPELLEDADKGLTELTRSFLAEQYDRLCDLDERVRRCDKQIEQLAKTNAVCQRLQTIHGVGVITASAVYAAAGSGQAFTQGRHFSAWLGLVPKQHSTGGKTVLRGISKRGDAYLRTLFIHGARSVVLHSKHKTDRLSRWIQALLVRRGHNRTCVAVANKLARIAWAVMRREQVYQPA